MPKQSLALTAPADRALQLWFEPWAEDFTVPAGALVELHANSRVAGQLMFEEQEGRTVVYGWGGSTLRLMLDGRIVKSFDEPAPDFMDRESFGLLFAPPPAYGAARPSPTPAPAKLRRWWQFWAK
ncbi:MAG: hypothetical protein JO006_04585 [Paucibacter sp.]|nr:hypothetical protein [Roseateles sp.]